MNPNKMNIDQNWKGMYKAGGFSLLIAGCIPILYLLFVIIMQQTIPPLPLETLENPGPPVTLFLIAIIGEALLMPGVLGLYFALKDTKKAHMLIATALWMVAVLLFLISRGLILSLLPISNSYTATTSETMKAAYLASAELALEAENVFATMALIFLSVASIIIGLVLRKGVFGKRIGYVVIVAGIITLFTPFGVMIGLPFIIPFSGVILTAVWQFFIGAKLYKLGTEAINS
jgi:hypothetical protein